MVLYVAMLLEDVAYGPQWCLCAWGWCSWCFVVLSKPNFHLQAFKSRLFSPFDHCLDVLGTGWFSSKLNACKSVFCLAWCLDGPSMVLECCWWILDVPCTFRSCKISQKSVWKNLHDRNCPSMGGWEGTVVRFPAIEVTRPVGPARRPNEMVLRNHYWLWGE